MISVRLTGGLGNQMFQYAAARALAERRGTRVVVDASAYCAPRAWRHYRLWQFARLNLRPLPSQLVSVAWHKIVQAQKAYSFAMQGLGFDPVVIRLPDRTSLRGYFASERYFADSSALIRSLFDPSEFLSQDDVDYVRSRSRGRPMISVHVRRGDYVGNDLFDIGDIEDYYKAALNEICGTVADPVFFVFSDDPSWCLQWPVLRGLDAHVVSQPTRSAFQDLALMAACHHHIISNSTFSWWAAWLCSNPHKRVLLPSQWLNKHTTEECCLSVPGWTEINVRSLQAECVSR